jgi:hypothetical protein
VSVGGAKLRTLRFSKPVLLRTFEDTKAPKGDSAIKSFCGLHFPYVWFGEDVHSAAGPAGLAPLPSGTANHIQPTPPIPPIPPILPTPF